MKKIVKIVVSLIVLHSCLAMLVSCQRSDNNQADGGSQQTGIQNNEPSHTANAVIQTITEWHEAVGTVRPMVETTIQARITGQVLDVKAKPGNRVEKGDTLVSLDSRQLQSKLTQAKQARKVANAGKKQAMQGIASAKAAFEESKSTYERVKSYHASQAATKVDLERANAAHLQAKAELSRSKEALSAATAALNQASEMVKEAEIGLGYTQIVAPDSGEILQRYVEPGDMAMPGKRLFVLRTSNTLLLEAYLREGLIGKAKVGQELKVAIDSLAVDLAAQVVEVVPYADPSTRTFLVKVKLPVVEGLYPGMYGKLLIAHLQRDIILVPPQAILKVGQLEMVLVKEGERWVRRMVKTGKRFDGLLEVLSGLQGKEQIGWEEPGNA